MKSIVVALKIFFRLLKVRGLANQDPGEHIRLPKLPLHLPRTLSRLEMEELLSTDLGSRPFPLRDQAMVELLYSSGLRISELTGARLENLSLPERIIRVVGKGSKTRLAPIGQPACAAIERYLTQEREGLIKKGTGNEIFLSSGGARLTAQRAWQIIKEVAALAGLETNVYPHLLRPLIRHASSPGRSGYSRPRKFTWLRTPRAFGRLSAAVIQEELLPNDLH
jgi:integrase/recombinase XerD